MSLLNDQVYAIIPIDNPSPVAFMNVFEKGDKWIKIKGCEDCPLENRVKCCGNCPFIIKSTGECKLHLDLSSPKPFNCVIYPNPKTCKTTCYLEWECVQGTRKGQIRRVKDINDVFVEGGE